MEEGLGHSNDFGVKLRKETPISASLLLVDALLFQVLIQGFFSGSTDLFVI